MDERSKEGGVNVAKRLLALDSRPLELMTGLEALLWGIWLLFPFQTFTTTVSFRVLGLWAPEWVWGLATGTLGIIQVYSVIYSLRNGHRLSWLRWFLTLTMVGLWSVVDVAFLLANSQATATVTYLIFVIAAVWSALAIAAGLQNER